MMNTTWTAEDVLEMARGFQKACVLTAAAELELFTALVQTPLSAPQLAQRLACDPRALTMLLDALAALNLLNKRGDQYHLPPSLAPLLVPGQPGSVLAMVQHQANCLRRWGQLAQVVKSGRAAQRAPSVRGEAGDKESFIAAMHDISVRVADDLVSSLGFLPFRHLLDVGGASGTWTMAFLRACPQARATLFDLPHVIPMARQRLEEAGLLARVRLAAGDFSVDPLPRGADLVWVSAIIHQNSRPQNRALFDKVFSALDQGGRILIRDVVMDDSRTAPESGALFAVNMLTGTERGGTYTFSELREDLLLAGFQDPALVRRDQAMNSVVVASRPTQG